MFDVLYDDFKRKLDANKTNPWRAEKIETCYKDTPTYNVWFPQFMSETNTDIHVTTSPDGKLFTFYKLVKKEQTE